jgi:hypothetical protein
MKKEEFKILVPTGMLGYGFNVKWFERGLERNPDLIACDSGSTDSGPQKLALGAMTCQYDDYYREMKILIDAGQKKGIPVHISSSGGDGSNLHVDKFVEMAQKIAAEAGYKLKIGVIYADIDKTIIKKRMDEGRVYPCGYVPELTKKDVDDAVTIVAQMGFEPYIEAIKKFGKLDLILAGRSYDPSPIACLALNEGFDPGLCWHAAKIAECGAQCAEPGSKSILVTIRKDHFELDPCDPNSNCKPYSVAAHTLYEKSHPYLLKGPGGTLDLSGCKFDSLDEHRVKVSGSKFLPAEKYTVKLEGASIVGFRTIAVSGIRDPIMLGQIDEILAAVKTGVENDFPQYFPQSQIIYHVYGKNGVMGDLEPVKDFVPLELGVIIEVASDTQEAATRICNRVRVELLHYPYKRRIATAGNTGSPFTPLEIPLGNVCKFNIYHLMEIDNPLEVFKLKLVEAGK